MKKSAIAAVLFGTLCLFGSATAFLHYPECHQDRSYPIFFQPSPSRERSTRPGKAP